MHQRAALKIDAVAGATLDCQTHQTSRRENQGEADERPLLPQKVEVRVLE